MQKTEQSSESMLLAFFLTLSGGFMDAYSYLCRGKVFANAQTGNVLLFGINLAAGNLFAAFTYAFPIFSFIFGILMSEWVRFKYKEYTRIHWRQIIILAQALTLIAVAFLPQDLNPLANSLISFACGAQVQTFRKFHGQTTATTMCIGNLRTAATSFCDYLINKNKSSLARSIRFFSVIAIFAFGAVIGDVCVIYFKEYAIIASSILLLIGFAVMCRRPLPPDYDSDL